MFYRLRDFVERHLLKLIIIFIICITLCFILLFSLKRQVEDINNTDNTDFSLDGLENELPKNINGVYEGFNKLLENNDNIKITYNKKGYIEIHNKITNVSYGYLQYDEKYDCTILVQSLTQEEPVSIFYHYLYDTSADMYNEIIKTISDKYLNDKEFDVKLEPNEDGSVNLTIN